MIYRVVNKDKNSFEFYYQATKDHTPCLLLSIINPTQMTDKCKPETKEKYIFEFEKSWLKRKIIVDNNHLTLTDAKTNEPLFTFDAMGQTPQMVLHQRVSSFIVTLPTPNQAKEYGFNYRNKTPEKNKSRCRRAVAALFIMGLIAGPYVYDSVREKVTENKKPLNTLPALRINQRSNT